jgi:hypothetical protein
VSSPRTAGFGGELERRVGGAGGGLPLVILPQGRWFQGPEPPQAVVLAMRIGDARSRFTNARSLKAYAGSAPVTRASGKSLTVTHRRVKTNAWPPSATSEPSPRSKPHPAPERTRTDAKPPATVTPPPHATCSTDSSAVRATACKPDSTTTNRSHSPLPTPTPPTPQLDKLSAWDVASAGCRRQPNGLP